MADKSMEHLPYSGESASDARAYQLYREESSHDTNDKKGRGKSLLALVAVREDITPEIRKSWAPGNEKPIKTSEGIFDAIVCTVAYHFTRHGSTYGNIAEYTGAAQEYFKQHRNAALPSQGNLKLEFGTYTKDGRILTFSKPKHKPG